MAEKPYKPGILFLKFFDIFLLTIYYFVLAFYISTGMDYVFGKYDSSDDEQKPTWKLLLECIVYTFSLLIVFYIARNIVERIPFPFEGLWGFRSELVKERGGDVVFIFLLFFYQDYYNKKLNFLAKRLIGDYKAVGTTVEAPKPAVARHPSPRMQLKI
jgi:hypothetical protein